MYVDWWITGIAVG